MKERRVDEPRKSTPFILGEILATLAKIEESMSRLVFRADDAEKRIERLEIRNAGKLWYEKLIERASIAGAGALVVMLFNGSIHL